MEMFKKSVFVLILILSNSFDFQQFLYAKERNHDTSRSEATVLSRSRRSVAIGGLDVFGFVLGLVSFGFSVADKIENDKKINEIIKKLNLAEKNLKKISWATQYSEPEQQIIIAYNKRALYLKAKDIKTINDNIKDFMDYMENTYSAAGLKIYNGIFSKKKIFGSNLFEDKPIDLKDCYNFHAALIMLLGKAAVVELSYDYRYKVTSDDIVKAKAETWRERVLKLQKEKEELCDTFNRCNSNGMSLLPSSGWVFTIFLSVMLTSYVIN